MDSIEEAIGYLNTECGKQDRCFLCGVELSSTNRTDEHVFPKWLLQGYGLYDLSLVVLNRTSIPYRQLTIPCCADCNNGKLGPIESQMASAVQQGASAVRELDEWIVYRWLAKILFGILFKEHLLPQDRGRPHLGTIVPESELRFVEFAYLLLQGARIPVSYHGGLPGSIFIYDCLRSPERLKQFDYKDWPSHYCISLRIGSVGLIASLADRGMLRALLPVFEELQTRKLHPLQWSEVTALLFYHSSRMKDIGSYLTISSANGSHIIANGPSIVTPEMVFHEWDPTEYALVLAQLVGFPKNKLQRGPLVRTWLEDGNGLPIDAEALEQALKSDS